MPSGTIIVYPETTSASVRVTIYARVSSAVQKKDLSRQANRLRDYAPANGWPVASIIEEIGSGLNGCRKELPGLLADPSVGAILIEHRDRLARFGFEYIETLMSQGRSIMVADETEEMSRHLVGLH